MGSVATSLALVMLAVATTITLLCLALATALPGVVGVDHPPPLAPARPVSGRRLRLRSRALFASRTTDAITLDCLLVGAEEGPGLPPHLAPHLTPPARLPVGLPFTLQLRAPDAGWFAGRVEELLQAWAEENRELVLELREDRGRVRTTIANGDSSVYLELDSAAGLTQS